MYIIPICNPNSRSKGSNIYIYICLLGLDDSRPSAERRFASKARQHHSELTLRPPQAQIEDFILRCRDLQVLRQRWTVNSPFDVPTEKVRYIPMPAAIPFGVPLILPIQVSGPLEATKGSIGFGPDAICIFEVKDEEVFNPDGITTALAIPFGIP